MSAIIQVNFIIHPPYHAYSIHLEVGMHFNWKICNRACDNLVMIYDQIWTLWPYLVDCYKFQPFHPTDWALPRDHPNPIGLSSVSRGSTSTMYAPVDVRPIKATVINQNLWNHPWGEGEGNHLSKKLIISPTL